MRLFRRTIVLAAVAMSTCVGVRVDASLWHAVHDGTKWRYQMVDANDVDAPSLALDSQDRAHISYFVEERCNSPGNAGCGSLGYATQQGGGWDLSVLDQGQGIWGVGYGSSLVIDSSDHPHIAYSGKGFEGLKYTTFDGLAWSSSIVAPDGAPGDIELDPAGNPVVAYVNLRRSPEQGVGLATIGQTDWQTEAIDSSFTDSFEISLELDSQGVPHVTYYDGDARDLRYASKTAGVWNIETVESAGTTGWDSALALDQNDVPHIAYYNATERSVKYAVRDGAGWSIHSFGVPGLGFEGGARPSLAIDDLGRVHLAFNDTWRETVEYAMFDGVDWRMQTIASGYFYSDLSLAIDSHGRPNIVFSYATPVPEPPAMSLALLAFVGIPCLRIRAWRLWCPASSVM